MTSKLTLLLALSVACANPTKKEAQQSTQEPAPTTAVKTDSKPAADVPAPAVAWPPAGYRLKTEPMGAPVRGIPGWVELPSLAKHKATEAVAPQKPLLNGTFDDEGMFYTDGKVDGAAPVTECANETFLNITKMTSSPALPVAAPDTILLYLCEGKVPVIGKEGLLVPAGK